MRSFVDAVLLVRSMKGQPDGVCSRCAAPAVGWGLRDALLASGALVISRHVDDWVPVCRECFSRDDEQGLLSEVDRESVLQVFPIVDKPVQKPRRRRRSEVAAEPVDSPGGLEEFQSTVSAVVEVDTVEG